MASPPLPGERVADKLSKRLLASYVLDWLVILVIAGAGGYLYHINGSHHAFSLDDRAISYPLVKNTVSIIVVGLVAFVAPAVIVALLSLLLQGSSIKATGKRLPRSLVWRRRLWEWNTGWLGLCLSLAGAFLVTSALKDIVGKPRPDLLARCDPDLSNIAPHLVGGLGMKFEEAPVIVDINICRQTDLKVLYDGFAAFPSGHSSFSWAGLLYLSLWLSAKFAITFPFPSFLPSIEGSSESNGSGNSTKPHLRRLAAAPPLLLLLLVSTPVAIALYVCATRYADYMHSGWDIIAGSLIGAFFAWLGFRWYHIPIRFGGPDGRGGWSWGPRSRDRAFWVGYGSAGFVGDEGWKSAEARERDGYQDLELGPVRHVRGRATQRSSDEEGLSAERIAPARA